MKNKKTLFISVYDLYIERTKLKKILRTVAVLHHAWPFTHGHPSYIKDISHLQGKGSTLSYFKNLRIILWAKG